VVASVVPAPCVVLAATPAVVAPVPSVVVGAAVLASPVGRTREYSDERGRSL